MSDQNGWISIDDACGAIEFMQAELVRLTASLDGLAKAIRNLNVEVRMGTVHVKVEEKGVE